MLRLLIIDESLDKRLAQDLQKRGRPAKSHREIGFTTLDDPNVFPILAAIETPWVLVTGDDFMPAEHDAALRAITATVATVDGEWLRLRSAHNVELEHEQFKQETVHRWAHSMAEQHPGTWRRYNPWRNDVWKLRKQHARRLAAARGNTDDAARLRDTDPDARRTDAGAQPVGEPDPGEGQLFRQ